MAKKTTDELEDQTEFELAPLVGAVSPPEHPQRIGFIEQLSIDEQHRLEGAGPTIVEAPAAFVQAYTATTTEQRYYPDTSSAKF